MWKGWEIDGPNVLLTIFHSSIVLRRITSPTSPLNFFPSIVWIDGGGPAFPAGGGGNGGYWLSKTTSLRTLTSLAGMSARNGGNAGALGMNFVLFPVAGVPVTRTEKRTFCGVLSVGSTSFWTVTL